VTNRGAVTWGNGAVEFEREKSSAILRPVSFSHRAVTVQSKYRTSSSVVHTILFAANDCFEKHSKQLWPSDGKCDFKQFLSSFDRLLCEPPPPELPLFPAPLLEPELDPPVPEFPVDDPVEEVSVEGF
jgi:hypothetical protein